MFPSQVYPGQVVHLIDGTMEYFGEIIDHPMNIGSWEGWYRIKNPCIVVYMKKGPNEPPDMKIVRLGGSPDYIDHYDGYIDVYIPKTFKVDIRPLNPKGQMMKAYMNSISIIRKPGTQAVVDISKSRMN